MLKLLYQKAHILPSSSFPSLLENPQALSAWEVSSCITMYEDELCLVDFYLIL